MTENKLYLDGSWRLAMGQGKSVPEKAAFHDTIDLPSTTECAKKGIFDPDYTETLHLSRRYPIEGMVWYERDVCIPEEWKDKEIILTLERTKFTTVYVDGCLLSRSFETIISQKHRLGTLETGTHRLTIGVDNALTSYEDFPAGLMDGHQYSDHTQTNWNGILGEIYLEAKGQAYITGMTLVKEKESNRIRTRLTIFSHTAEKGILKLELCMANGRWVACTEHIYALQEGWNEVELFLNLHEELKYWDEFSPVLYKAKAKWCDSNGNELDVCDIVTGFTNIRVKDKLIYNNGVPVYLRGTVDCCIYPLTGAAPMDEEAWMDILEKMRTYGLNHYRFHSWCPPEAAFCAADKLGVYLEVEMSGFAIGLYEKGSEKYDSVLETYYYDQAEKILKVFGNHPSFLIFAVGNELVGEIRAYERLIAALRPLRPDKLYTQGANNFLEEPQQGQEDDLWIMMRTSKTENIRGSFAHSDKPLGHVQRSEAACTSVDYKSGLSLSRVPLIAHEIGQYQMYPDYREIDKYTGVLEPSALKIFRKRLEVNGLIGYAEDFNRASGMLMVQCYKEEIEAQLRTEGMSGFQLLGLQDFPGQGTALVGILDSFLDDKGLIGAEEWRQFCAPGVVLGRFDSYVWYYDERIRIEVLCPNFTGADLYGEVKVCFKSGSVVLAEHSIGYLEAARGRWSCLPAAELELPDRKGAAESNGMSTAKAAAEITMELSYAGLKNCYTLFIYPREPLEDAGDVIITDQLDNDTEALLEKGRNVLLLNHHTEGEIPGFFSTDFWCYPMFRNACESKGIETAPGTMGLLIKKDHPALCEFPTRTWGQWQWQQIVVNGHSDILDEEPQAELIVQVIDNFERNHRLGLLYEKKSGQGTLLVCNVNLKEYLDRPEMRCLYNCLLRYLKNR